MLIAIEGPDKSGKSTLFRELRETWAEPASQQFPVFVPGLPMDKALLPHMHWIEQRQAALWDAVYDEKRVYICDRSVFVSAPVYDQVYNRPLFNLTDEWRQRVRVLYVDCPMRVLLARYAKEPDTVFDSALYERTVAAYWHVIISNFQFFTLNSECSLHAMTVEAIKRIHIWRAKCQFQG